MFQHIYLEADLKEHPLARRILRRFPQAVVTECEHYGEIFNPKAQNFRLQKQAPALILARKRNKYLLPIPPRYGIGARENYYFSHALNCVYDCRYCFLQGMYRSANCVLFVNYDDFKAALQRRIDEVRALELQPVHFFSGYDCDSLALEPVSGFTKAFLPFFADNPTAVLELRTKSTQIRDLLRHAPLRNCVVAFSLNPQPIVSALEADTPSLHKRLRALQALQEAGWRIGLRFDPVIYTDDFTTLYGDFFARVFQCVRPENLHSVTLGTFRLPAAYFRAVSRLYPREKLFAGRLSAESADGVTYQRETRRELFDFCRERILSYMPEELFFPCEEPA